MTASPLFHRARLLAGLTLLLAGAVCNASAGAGDNGSASLLARIDAERGSAACDSDAQCHSIGIGARACGGPERYLAWSDKTGDGTRLRALVAAHAQARRADNARSGMMSTCLALPDPGAVCTAGRCALREPAAAPDPVPVR
jgi:hypothetical protein